MLLTRLQQGEKERHVIYIQTNLISFLADLAVRFSKREVGEIILPQFVESLEQGDTNVPGLLRIKVSKMFFFRFPPSQIFKQLRNIS